MQIDITSNKEFYLLVESIIKNEQFNQLKKVTHHGLNRYDHSIRVAYYSYLLTKFFHLNYESVAKAGLLHDFFLDDFDNKYLSLVKHPLLAVENAKKNFSLTKMEEDIIISHMFPIAPMVPKYAESWIVDIVDDIVSIFEKAYAVRHQLSAACNFLLLIILNSIK